MTGPVDILEEPMDERTRDTVLRRLERLERDNRRWKRVGGLVVAGLGLAVLLGAVPSKKPKVPDEVRGGRFILIDKAHKARAELEVASDNQPRVILSDQAGSPRLVLTLSQYGEPLVHFIDGAGTRRIALSLDLYGILLRFTDAAGNVRAAVTVPAEGEPELELLGKDNKVLWRAP